MNKIYLLSTVSWSWDAACEPPYWGRCGPRTGRESWCTGAGTGPETGDVAMFAVQQLTWGILMTDIHMEFWAPWNTIRASTDWTTEITLSSLSSRWCRRSSTLPDTHLQVLLRQESTSGAGWPWSVSVKRRRSQLVVPDWESPSLLISNCSLSTVSSRSASQNVVSSLFLLFLPMMLMICILRKNVTMASPPIWQMLLWRLREEARSHHTQPGGAVHYRGTTEVVVVGRRADWISITVTMIYTLVHFYRAWSFSPLCPSHWRWSSLFSSIISGPPDPEMSKQSSVRRQRC